MREIKADSPAYLIPTLYTLNSKLYTLNSTL